MRAYVTWFAGALAFASGCSSASAVPAPARLLELTKTLQTVRATKPVNSDRDAGPELTAVKQALRRWVEAQLPPPSKPGPTAGTEVVVEPHQLTILADRLNDELDRAGLTCGDTGSRAYQCSGPPADLESDRGTVEGVQLGLVDYGRYLLLVTGVGVRCGFDESIYLYKADASTWKLAFASEQDDYRTGVYAVQNVTEVAISDSSSSELQSAPPPLVATLGFGPWCSSTWSSLFTRLWRMSPTSVSPKSLLDRSDSLWWGNDDFGHAALSANDFLVERVDASIDGGVHSRKHIMHYRIGPNDRLERIDPVALRPMDFVDEWLITKWKQAAAWIDKSADRAKMFALHNGYTPYQDLDTFDGTKRCKSDRTLFQVALYREPQNLKRPAEAKTSYFEVRWTPPFVFRLVAISDQPFPGCNLADPAAEEDSTLFPDSQWHPGH